MRKDGDLIMQKKGESFVAEVLQQIKSKEAKENIKAELSYHLQETKRIFMKDGLTEEEADEKATAQMGNPTKLGLELNRVHRPRIDWIMLTILIVTLGIGFLPMLTLPPGINGGIYTDDYYIVNKAIIILLGISIVLGLMFFDYRKLQNFQWVFFGIAVVVFLLLVIAPTAYRLGTPRLIVGPIIIEISMILPLLYLFWAAFLQNQGIKYWKAGLLFAITFFFLQFLGTHTTVIIYVIMVFSMVVWRLRKAAWLILGMLTFVCLVGLVPLFSIRGYWLSRFGAFVNPEQDAQGWGFMYIKVKALMKNAGLFGNTKQVDFLPEAHTDFVFVNFTYHYGWVLAGILVLLLALLLVRMIESLRKIKDPFGKMLIVGGATIFSIHFIYNIAMTIGFLPMIGMPLPFISYGLMPTLLHSLIVGIFLSVYRRKDIIQLLDTSRTV